jgi:hypothetical protein
VHHVLRTLRAQLCDHRRYVVASQDFPKKSTEL